eukprot:m.1037524 g.1037524  ORF g.1037524 m.1037524 type:complete len:94 (-) comp24144_c0_seq1:45-326(-)
MHLLHVRSPRHTRACVQVLSSASRAAHIIPVASLCVSLSVLSKGFMLHAHTVCLKPRLDHEQTNYAVFWLAISGFNGEEPRSITTFESLAGLV